MKAPRHLHIGWALLGWLLITAGIALNRGIDLLWGMVALLVCALIAALALPYLQLRQMSVRRVLPVEGVAGEALTIAYEIEIGWPLPCYGIELEDRLGETPDLVPAAYLPRIRGRERFRFRWTPPVRGVRRFGDVVAHCGFPLGLVRATRRIDMPAQEVVVYPSLTLLRHLDVAGGADPTIERIVSSRRGGHEEFFALKPYRPGDELRSIHWRSSAHAGELLVREFEHPLDRQLWIVLDLAADAHAGIGVHSTFEYMCRIANAVAYKAIHQGFPVGLIYRSADTLHRIDPANDTAAFLRLREVFARVDPAPAPELQAWLADAEDLPRGGAWLLFNLGGAAVRPRLHDHAQRHAAEAQIVEFDVPAFDRGATPVASAPMLQRAGRGPAWIVSPGAALDQLFG